jgi:hypothetical protein
VYVARPVSADTDGTIAAPLRSLTTNVNSSEGIDTVAVAVAAETEAIYITAQGNVRCHAEETQAKERSEPLKSQQNILHFTKIFCTEATKIFVFMSGQWKDWEEDFAEIRRRQMASRMNTKASLVESAWNLAIQTAAKFDESVLSTIVLAYAYDPRAPVDELDMFLSPYMSNSVEWYPPDSDDVTTDHRIPSWAE